MTSLREAGAFELTEEDAFGHAHLIRVAADGLSAGLGPSSRWFRGGRLTIPRPFGSGVWPVRAATLALKAICRTLPLIPPDRTSS